MVSLLLTKLFLLFFTQTIDADAVTRSQLGSQLLDNPRLITEGVWPPIHIYLTSISLWIHNDVIWTPVIMNVILSLVTLYPIFKFLQREFKDQKALIGVLIFALSPIIFRTSLMNLSETSFYLFIAFGLNTLSKAFRSDELKPYLLSGITFTFASAIRMEAWPLIAILTLALVLNKKLVPSLVFLCTALIFPVYWMYGNYVAHDDPLFSIRAINVLESSDWEDLARKIWFFPFMLLISIGPIFTYALIKGFKNWRERIKSPWTLAPLLLLGIILYKSVTGTMIAHPRFIGLTTLLCLPLILQDTKWLKNILMSNFRILGSLILTIALSFLFNIESVSPLPIIKNKEMLTYTRSLGHQIKPKDLVFIDFIDWEDSYFMSLQLFQFSQNQIIIDGYTSHIEAFSIFESVYDKSKKQFWLLNPEHRTWIDKKNNFEILQESEIIIIAVSNND